MIRMTVTGQKQVEATYGNILSALTGPQVAEAMLAGAEVVAEEVRDNILRRELVDSGKLYDSVKARKTNQNSAEVRVGTPYAAVHEYGLRNQPITQRQRGFFWYKWSATKDTLWKALALSRTYTIPARPYFRPAVDSKTKEAITQVMRKAAEILTHVAGLS